MGFADGRAEPRGCRTVAYTILESRSQEAARQVLDGYRGIVIADGYGAYDALARGGPGFTLAHCWAHVRRKFIDAKAHYPEPCAEVLDLIGQLYAVARECAAVDVGTGEDERARALTIKTTTRRERSAPIVAAIRTWALQQRALPERGLGKAIVYILRLWLGLTRFFDDGRIPLDNNATERGRRGSSSDGRSTTPLAPSAAPRSRRSSTASSSPRSSAASSRRRTCSTRRAPRSRTPPPSRYRTCC